MSVGAERQLCAVIVHHRTPHETRVAVESLLASRHPLARIVIVNNDANDDGGKFLDELRTNVVWLPAGGNLGFAGGVNLGIRASLDAGADAVLLVNSDASVAPDCLTILDTTLRKHPPVGIVG